MKQQLHNKLKKQSLKDEKIRQLEISGAESVVQDLVNQGFKVESEYLENRVALYFILDSGKTVAIQVDYTSLVNGHDNIVKLIKQLNK